MLSKRRDILSVFTIFFIVTGFGIYTLHNYQHRGVSLSSARAATSQLFSRLPTVYMWNGWQAAGDTYKNFSRIYEEFTVNHCGIPKPCRMVIQTSLFNPEPHSEADLVVFYANALPRTPPIKYPGQVWAFRGQEAPAFFTRIIHYLQFEYYNNFFNYTNSYQEDSTHPIPFGGYHPLKDPSDENIDYYSRKLAFAKTQGVASNDAQTLSIETLWLVSNCIMVSSARNEYVAELASLKLPIKIRGRSPVICSSVLSLPVESTLRDHTDNIEVVDELKRYTFYITFENALCKDYLTEKLWKVFNSDSLVIPIVLGGRDGPEDYKRLAPPNSYIHVLDFKTPAHLIEHLKKVASNRTLFNSYHGWRGKYTVKPVKPLRDYNEICEMCELAQNKPANVIKDFAAYFSYGQCINVRDKACEVYGACSSTARLISLKMSVVANLDTSLALVITFAVFVIASFVYIYKRYRTRSLESHIGCSRIISRHCSSHVVYAIVLLTVLYYILHILFYYIALYCIMFLG